MITPDEFMELINDPEAAGYERVFVMDARFPYEFENGHIIGAVNIPEESIIGPVFEDLISRFDPTQICLVFHCEFSSLRGPTLAKAWRTFDRAALLAAGVPYAPDAVMFPHRFVLQGGYAGIFERFHEEAPGLFTGGYVSMDDQEWLDECRSCMRRSQSSRFRDLPATQPEAIQCPVPDW